jgi:hypothetical protein
MKNLTSHKEIANEVCRLHDMIKRLNKEQVLGYEKNYNHIIVQLENLIEQLQTHDTDIIPFLGIYSSQQTKE